MKRILLLLGLCAASASAQQHVVEADTSLRESTYWGAVAINNSTGDFAPYFIGSLNGGRISRANGMFADGGVKIGFEPNKRFTWGAGAEVIAGLTSANDYARWDASTQTWGTTKNRQSLAWIQQLYGELKYRQVFLRVGQKDNRSHLLDETVSSGDLTRSSNSRGIPGAAAGFVDFQDIPFTNGWVQISGEIEYGRFTDDGFVHDQFNYYNFVVTSNVNYTYKYCYFRTNPNQPFSVIAGMQTAGQFGGSMQRYSKGQITYESSRGFRLGDVVKMFFPIQGNNAGDDYYEGNSLGSWDFKARYRLDDGRELSFAFQWPWEDGSGIGKQNGFDGLWGLYYSAPKGKPLVAAAAVEYLDFRNQSGPIHWAQHDHPGTDLNGGASGGDDYYNNEYYGSFSNYGLSIGSPFLVSPLYNLNGFSGYAHNRARGIHAAVRGYVYGDWQWGAKYSWQQAWGRGRVPSTYSLSNNSVMLSATWTPAAVAPGMIFDAKLAFDLGHLRGNNLGILMSATYVGNFSLFKK